MKGGCGLAFCLIVRRVFVFCKIPIKGMLLMSDSLQRRILRDCSLQRLPRYWGLNPVGHQFKDSIEMGNYLETPFLWIFVTFFLQITNLLWSWRQRQLHLLCPWRSIYSSISKESKQKAPMVLECMDSVLCVSSPIILLALQDYQNDSQKRIVPVSQQIQTLFPESFPCLSLFVIPHMHLHVCGQTCICM